MWSGDCIVVEERRSGRAVYERAVESKRTRSSVLSCGAQQACLTSSTTALVSHIFVPTTSAPTYFVHNLQCRPIHNTTLLLNSHRFVPIHQTDMPASTASTC